jgi:hypothetical protein
MAIHAEEILLQPLREVVERGKEAVANGEGSTNLHRKLASAGQALQKEGERALKKVQQPWNAHIAKYGAVFTDGVMENGKKSSIYCSCPPWSMAVNELPANTSRWPYGDATES